MTIALNINHYLVCLLLVSASLNAQLFSPQEEGDPSLKIGALSLGYMYGTGVGSSYVSEGMNNIGGYQLGFQYNVVDKVYLGSRVDILGYTLDDTTFTGSYDETRNLGFGIFLGYRFFETNRFATSFYTGIGRTFYTNKRGNEKFGEQATSFFLSGDVEIKLSRLFQFYLAPELRFDRLNIEAPAQVEDRLNKISYFMVNAGIRFSFYTYENKSKRNKDNSEDADNISN